MNKPLSPANPADIAEMKRKARDAEREFVDLMEDRRFRNFVWRFLGEAGVFQNRFSENSNRHAHEAGKRVMGLWVMTQIDTLCPERYAQMSRENAPQQPQKDEESDG